MSTEIKIVDQQALDVIAAIERADESVQDAKAGMHDAINAKLEAAALVAAVRGQKGKSFSDWWRENISHRYALAISKELCKLDALARKRPVDSDRGTLALVGLLPGPQHDSKVRSGDDLAWNGIADFANGIAVSLDKLCRLIDLYGGRVEGAERDMAEGRIERWRRAVAKATMAVNGFMGDD